MDVFNKPKWKPMTPDDASRGAFNGLSLEQRGLMNRFVVDAGMKGFYMGALSVLSAIKDGETVDDIIDNLGEAT